MQRYRDRREGRLPRDRAARRRARGSSGVASPVRSSPLATVRAGACPPHAPEVPGSTIASNPHQRWLPNLCDGTIARMSRSSVADELRASQSRDAAALSPSERVALALELGRECIALFATQSGLGASDARKELERRRQRGRRPSACIEALLA